MSDIISFGRFGRSFQEGLCQLILEDRPFADRFLEVFCENYLELKYLRVFASKIIEYREEYSTHPGWTAIQTILHTGLDDHPLVVREQINNFFEQIKNNKVQDADFIKNQALDFCRKQKLKEAMMQSMQLLDRSSYDKISKVINEALLLGAEGDGGHDFHKDFEARYEDRPRNPITTGWTLMDDICGGGHGQKELGVIIAPTGAGKSMALVHLGASALLAGLTVVHYSFELQDSVIATRYDSCITGINLGELFSFKEQILETVQNIEGSLIIKEYPTKSASTETLKNHLYKLKQRGIQPDLIIVDYGDLLKPINNFKEKRNELESIYEELRAIAKVNECPLWTASQTNRSGLNAEVITMESISEAFSKCFVADFIFSLSRTIKDKNNNSGRIFIAKNRNGIDGVVFPIYMDTKNVSIKVLKMEEFSNKSDSSIEENKQLLRDKYKQFKNGEEE